MTVRMMEIPGSSEDTSAEEAENFVSKRKPGDETGVEYFINNYNMEVGDAKMWAAKVFKPKEFNTNYRLLKHFNYLTFIALLVTFSLVRNNYWPFEPIADVITYTCPWLVRKLKFFWRLNSMIWQRPKESAIIMKRVQPRGGCAFPAMVDWYAFAYLPIWGMLSGSLFRLAVMCDFDINEIRRIYQGRGRLSRLPEKLEEPDTDFS